MTPIQPHDYIQSYEAGMEALKTQPLDRNLQHMVVLALARAGALDFAMAEYDRFGLAAVQDHEDIMALNGRLSKDLYLRSSGAQSLQHAKNAAQKYEAAFKNTLGYYSGINSATMAFMAGMPMERVMSRVDAIETLLPTSPDNTPTDHYFIEATRAECFLLKGKKKKAIAALHAAIDFDPLNYTAHASTLKQFVMISTKRGESLDWLSDFRPPRPMHFAGHIRLDLNGDEQTSLKIAISDALQQEDIGFGYGALAAGGDILFAEALLEQGAELHVILPCAKEVFFQESVLPFGEDWAARFEDCLSNAASLKILTGSINWPDNLINRLSGLSAMGHAVLQGESLNTAPVQMLILNDLDGASYTSTHARDWAMTGNSQFRIVGGSHCALNLSGHSAHADFPCALKQSGYSNIENYDDIYSALDAAQKILSREEGSQISLHLNVDGENTEAILDGILTGATPQSLLASEGFVSVLAAMGGSGFNMTYAGQVNTETLRAVRCYTIQTMAGLTYILP